MKGNGQASLATDYAPVSCARQFLGEVECEWIETPGDDRLMTLTAPLIYLDSKGRRWEAPRGLRFDGASIPRILWSFVGGPYEGDYRRGALMHDAGCADQSRPRAEVDWMFYDAMRCDGVGFWKAKLIYTAVRRFGWIAWNEHTREKQRSATR